MKYIGLVLVAVAIVAVVVVLLRRSASKSGFTSRPHFKMPIDDVFSLKTPGGVVVVGVVADGEARLGDTLFVQTSDGSLQVRVEGMETYPAGADRSVKLERAGRGERVGIMLGGASKEQVKPHDLLVSSVQNTKQLPGRTANATATATPAAGVKPSFQKNEGSTTQTTTAHAWRTHPSLTGRFHPDYADDLQVIVHDGDPRVTKHRPELVWVRVTGCAGDVFAGRILNAPTQLATVRQNQEIRFIMPDGSKHPVLVTDKYLAERGDWIIAPCDKCGFSELFDAPSDLIRVIFPNMPPSSSTEMFTSFCPVCGGVQGVQSRSSSTASSPGGKSGR